jgi:hypothetical protein
MSGAIDRVPLLVDVEAEPRELNLAETVTLRLRLSVHADYALLETPAQLAQGATLGPFVVERAAAARPTLEGGRLVTTHDLALAPLETGGLTIPPIAFTASPTSPDAAPAVIETPAIDVAVVSLLEVAGESFTPAQIVAPIGPPAPEAGLPGWALGLGAAAVVGALVVVAILARRGRRAEPPLAALRRRAAALADLDDARARALETARVAREALELAVGPRARSATLPELRPLLTAVPALTEDDRRGLIDLLERAECAAYAPSAHASGDLDAAPALAAVERVVRERGGVR